MMRRTSYQAALLLALLFKQAAGSRARFSEQTVKRVAQRQRLKSAFVSSLREKLDDLGFAFLEIDRGYAMVPLAALNGAPPITVAKFMPDHGRGKDIDFERIEMELGFDEFDPDGEGT